MRSRGSLIRGTNGLSNGIVPWLKTLDSSVSAVNQGGKRKGAACVYLETWHADIEEFLELKDNTGDEARRTHNLNLANWVPDLFMERVEKDWTWSLFDPKKVPHLTDLFGAEFERAYVEAESQKLYERQVPARQLYARMMRTLAQTGNGWMTFKDPANARCNQTTDALVDGPDGQSGAPAVVHLSNLCTEILEVTNDAETAVCNLGSINLGHFVVVDPDTGAAEFDFERLGDVARTAVQLPRPGDRHQLLPDRRGRRVERPLAPGRARRDGPAGRVLPHAPAVRLARGPRPVAADRRGDLLQRPVGVVRPRRRRRPARRLRRDPRSPAARFQFDLCGRQPRRRRALGGAARRGSPSTACATRC